MRNKSIIALILALSLSGCSSLSNDEKWGVVGVGLSLALAHALFVEHAAVETGTTFSPSPPPVYHDGRVDIYHHNR